jgi:hypothetical protein
MTTELSTTDLMPADLTNAGLTNADLMNADLMNVGVDAAAATQPSPWYALAHAHVQLGFVDAHANPKMADSPYLRLLLEDRAALAAGA